MSTGGVGVEAAVSSGASARASSAANGSAGATGSAGAMEVGVGEGDVLSPWCRQPKSPTIEVVAATAQAKAVFTGASYAPSPAPGALNHARACAQSRWR